jgi:hypothetical protein
VKAARAAWRAEFATIDPSRLVFLDESGASTALARRHGRAPRGVRVGAAVPHGHWKVVTLTAAVRLGGVGACLAFDGATDTACSETYVRECLVPALRPGDIVVMDKPGVPQVGGDRGAGALGGGGGGGALPAGLQPGPQPD